MLCMCGVQKISRVMTRIRNACLSCWWIVELIINNYINIVRRVWRSSAVCRSVLPSTDILHPFVVGRTIYIYYISSMYINTLWYVSDVRNCGGDERHYYRGTVVKASTDYRGGAATRRSSRWGPVTLAALRPWRSVSHACPVHRWL